MTTSPDQIRKSVPPGTTNYLYDGMNFSANVIEEVDNAGNLLARYASSDLIDEALATVRGGTNSYYQADVLGSTTSLSNSAGALTGTYVYDSFGRLTTSTGTLSNPFQYTGRDTDPEIDLRYYRARYYDSNGGRFVSEDPIGFWAGINFYAYVENNPISFVDFTGTSDACTFGGCSGHKPPPPLPDEQFLLGAQDMWSNYARLRQRQWIGADKWYHCMANCQATNRGPGGALAAEIISFGRTNISSRIREPGDWRNDDRANKCGQQGGNCQQVCAPFVPKSSPGKPPFPGW